MNTIQSNGDPTVGTLHQYTNMGITVGLLSEIVALFAVSMDRMSNPPAGSFVLLVGIITNHR